MSTDEHVGKNVNSSSLGNSNGGENLKDKHLTIIQDPEYRRFKSTVNINLALNLFNTDR